MITETPRLLLREFNAADAGHLYDLNHDPEVLKYTGDRPFADQADAARFLEQYKDYDLYGMGRWAVVLKSTRAFTGWCGLKYRPDLGPEGEVDLGYRFFRKYWGQGIASEAATACIEYGFQVLKLNRIIGRVMEANAGSINVLEKCGMQFVKPFEFHEHPGLWYEIENPGWKSLEYVPVDCNYYDELEALATKKKEIEIMHLSETGVRLRKYGMIKTFFIKDKAEFMELLDGTTIRLDRLISADGKVMPRAVM